MIGSILKTLIFSHVIRIAHIPKEVFIYMCTNLLISPLLVLNFWNIYIIFIIIRTIFINNGMRATATTSLNQKVNITGIDFKIILNFSFILIFTTFDFNFFWKNNLFFQRYVSTDDKCLETRELRLRGNCFQALIDRTTDQKSHNTHMVDYEDRLHHQESSQCTHTHHQ